MYTHHYGSAPTAETANIVKMVMLIVCYSICSSMLLIINKVSTLVCMDNMEHMINNHTHTCNNPQVAVKYIPAASTILLAQFASCSAFIYILKRGKVLNDVDDLEMEKSKKFMPLVLAFVAILFCNMKALQVCHYRCGRLWCVQQVEFLTHCTP